MRDEPNTLGRQAIAMIHIDIPVSVTPFDTDETIDAALNEAVGKLEFPEEARVRAFVGFLPDPTAEMKVLTVQNGAFPEQP